MLRETVDLIETINLFHPPYLRCRAKIGTCEEFARLLGWSNSEAEREAHPRVCLLGDLDMNELWCEFKDFQCKVFEADKASLFFGAAQWGRSSDAVELYPSLTKLAQRYLAIRPSIALAESGFSHMNMVDRSSRGRLKRTALAAELLLRVNGPREGWLRRLQTTANPEFRKKTRKRTQSAIA